LAEGAGTFLEIDIYEGIVKAWPGQGPDADYSQNSLHRCTNPLTAFKPDVGLEQVPIEGLSGAILANLEMVLGYSYVCKDLCGDVCKGTCGGLHGAIVQQLPDVPKGATCVVDTSGNGTIHIWIIYDFAALMEELKEVQQRGEALGVTLTWI
jgi:hypothetical protein